MYVAVYAICKDEGPFVDRWMASMGEADGVFVLDTGSSDGTPERLRALGAQVREETISPWRFDTARNRSLELVPPEADICVCTDLDEVFQPGWREKVEAAWTPGTDRLLYRYTWNFLPDGREGTVYWYDKIHRRWGCRWVHPVHEVLAFDGGDPVARYVEGVHLEHHPDPAKSRAQYLPLLELAVEEDPDNDRNVHYLGREYFFHRRWEESIARPPTAPAAPPPPATAGAFASSSPAYAFLPFSTMGRKTRAHGNATGARKNALKAIFPALALL